MMPTTVSVLTTLPSGLASVMIEPGLIPILNQPWLVMIWLTSTLLVAASLAFRLRPFMIATDGTFWLRS